MRLISHCLLTACSLACCLLWVSCNPGESKEVLAAAADRQDMPWANEPTQSAGQESLNGRWERVDKGYGYRAETFVTIQDGILHRVGKDSMELGSVLRSLSLTSGGVVDIYVNDWRKQPGMYGFQWKDGEEDGRFYAYAIVGVIPEDKKLYLVFTILQRHKKNEAPVETQRVWICEKRG